MKPSAPSSGSGLISLQLTGVRGQTIAVPNPDGRYVHLQFRRFAGCPVCNLHIRSFARRADELRSAGVRTVVVFHSCRDTLAPYQNESPFDFIADPTKAL